VFSEFVILFVFVKEIINSFFLVSNDVFGCFLFGMNALLFSNQDIGRACEKLGIYFKVSEFVDKPCNALT
jgi:hypothetical protein